MGSKVSPVCPALRAELSSLLGRRRAAFDTLGHVQSSTVRRFSTQSSNRTRGGCV